MTLLALWAAGVTLFLIGWHRLFRFRTPTRGRTDSVCIVWIVKEERFIGPFIDEDSATLWCVQNVGSGVLFGIRPLEPTD